jgi:hypothetical protein
MRFLIMGSMQAEMTNADKDEFAAACRQIGGKLAERGHTIIVSATETWTADLYIIEGADKIPGNHTVILLESIEKNDPQARAIYLSKGYKVDGDHPSDLSKFRNIAFQTEAVGGRWPGNRIQAISKADAVILVGGRFGVATVGVSAPLLKIPVVALGSFAGTAKEVLEEVSYYYGQAGISVDDVRVLRSPWNTKSADTVVNIAEALVKRNPFRQDQVSQVVAASLIVLLLVGWVSVFIMGKGTPSDIAIFGLLGISALIGTGLRTELRLVANEMSLLSGRKITVEAIVGILLAFVFCLLYLAGNFVLTGTFVTLQGKQADDFSRVAVTLSILGISTAFLLEPAAENLRKRLGDIITRQG